MSIIPDRLNIDNTDKEVYEQLKEEKIFKERSNKELFLFAMAVGYKNEIKKKLNSKFGFVRTEYLSEEDLSLIKTVSISKQDVNILKDMKKVFKISEEYAHTGIKILGNKLKGIQFGSFDKKLEKDLLDFINE